VWVSDGERSHDVSTNDTTAISSPIVSYNTVESRNRKGAKHRLSEATSDVPIYEIAMFSLR